MIRCVPRKTFVKPHRTTARGRSTTIGSARISRSIAAPMSRPAVLKTRRTARTQAGSPVRQAREDRRKRAGRRRVEQGLHLPSQRDGLLDAFDGFVAERDVEGFGLVSVRPNERAEPGRARIVLAAAPDRVHVGRDRHQLGQMAVEIAVVVRRIEQALAFRPAIRIVEDREAREMDRPAAGEVDVRTLGGVLQRPARGCRLRSAGGRRAGAPPRQVESPRVRSAPVAPGCESTPRPVFLRAPTLPSL